jgi:hypothetical protein
MKYELKIDFKDNKQLEKVIKKTYFDDGNLGKLIGKKEFLTILKNDPLFIVFKGLNNITVRLTNEEMIDGIMRFVVDENDKNIKLYPVNNYCIIEDKKYSFY